LRLLRTLATSAAVLAALAATVAPAHAVPTSSPRNAPVTVPAVAAPTVARIDGADRYVASAAASRAAFPTGTHPDVVYLVSGVSPWESLSATAAAVAEHGALLLTRPEGIPGSIATELKRLAPPAVVLVGSTSILSNAVATQAKTYSSSVTRVAGAGRYQIAQSVVRRAFAAGGESHAWVATGRVWTDGLVAGAAAAARREPLLTVDGTAGSLPADTIDLVRDLGVTTLTLVGGAASVSPGIQAQLEGVLGAGSVTRATGADQYALAARVNALALPDLVAGTSFLANGRDFVNGLTGAFLAGTRARPLYYTSPFCVPAPVRPMLVGTRTTRVVLVGREGSLRDLVGQVVACGSTTTTTTTTASSPWVLVNKRHALRPRTYVPSGLVVPHVTHPQGQRLRTDAAAALATMFSAARAEGAGSMAIASGYRSYATQRSVYSHRVSANGKAYADKWIARPGYSEHQSGLSLDIAPVGNRSCSVHNCIGSTRQGAWLRRNAWRFGFVLRYESGYTGITGYNSEPWHFRYVGVPLSTAYHRGGWHTLEQFLAEPAAPTY
jgi:LAS superfamily LD-carboxypeptidase LdcB/putative cell wall-binding protein